MQLLLQKKNYYLAALNNAEVSLLATAKATWDNSGCELPWNTGIKCLESQEIVSSEPPWNEETKPLENQETSPYTELNCRIVSSSESTALRLQNFNSLPPEKPFWHLFTISTSSCKSLVAQYVCLQQKLKKTLCMNYHRDLAGARLWHPCKYQHKLFFCKPIGKQVQNPKFQF